MPRAAALALIACALFLRFLVPQGWMPMQTGQGWRITLCSGSGPMIAAPAMTMPGMTHAMAMPAHHLPADNWDAGDHPCAFANLALALNDPGTPVPLLPRLLLSAWIAGPAALVAIGRGLAAPPPPATGPPTLS